MFYLSAGHDYASLLFNFLDACLYAFASDDFVAKDMRAISLRVADVLPLGGPSASAAPDAQPPFVLRVSA